MSKSRGLSCIIGYALREQRNFRCVTCHVRAVRIGPKPTGEGVLSISWSDGALAVTEFASYEVLKSWLKRCRFAKGADLWIGDVDGEVRAGFVDATNPALAVEIPAVKGVSE